MSFNPDPNKQAQQVIFSRKTKKINHPPLTFSKSTVKSKYIPKTSWRDSRCQPKFRGTCNQRSK